MHIQIIIDYDTEGVLSVENGDDSDETITPEIAISLM